jgi:hypothetical protein
MRGCGSWKRFRDPVAFKVVTPPRLRGRTVAKRAPKTDKRNPGRGNAGVSQFGGSCPGDAANPT